MGALHAVVIYYGRDLAGMIMLKGSYFASMILMMYGEELIPTRYVGSELLYYCIGIAVAVNINQSRMPLLLLLLLLHKERSERGNSLMAHELAPFGRNSRCNNVYLSV
jgi:hypothetical protein